MGSLKTIVIAAALSLGACASGSAHTAEIADRISEVQATLAVEADRLESVRRQTARAEARMRRASWDAELHGCRARVEGIKAEVQGRTASCLHELAEQNRCVATAERKKGDFAIFGCLFGFAAAVVTGGAATPIALGGCVAGRLAGEVSAKACPSPVCTETFNDTTGIVLKENDLIALPICGWNPGLEVEAFERLVAGVPIDAVRSGTTGAQAALQKGDVLVFVGDMATPDTDTLDAALTWTSEGEELLLTYVRDGQRYVGRATASRLEYTGALGSKVRLGASLAGTSTQVTVREGAKVAAVVPGGPAQGAGILVGDVLLTVEGTPVESPDQYADEVRELAPEDKVSIILERNSARVRTVIKPPPGLPPAVL